MRILVGALLGLLIGRILLAAGMSTVEILIFWAIVLGVTGLAAFLYWFFKVR
jgi:hypothetical protein